MRQAERLPQGVRDPGFEDLLQRIDGSPVLGGFQNDLAQAEEIQVQSWRRRPLGSRMVDGMARMLAPVL